MITFDIITIFPKIFDSYLKESFLKRGQEKKLLKVNVHDLRKWTSDVHRTVDDRPFGGGLGMVLKIEPIYQAIEEIKRKSRLRRGFGGQAKVILFTPRGRKFNQKLAYQFSKLNQIILICGRYEGVDERVAQKVADMELSIGDYDLMGGEIPALTVIETVSRLIPGLLGKPSLLKERSKGNTSSRLLDFYLEPVNRDQLIELMHDGSMLTRSNTGQVKLKEIEPYYQMTITEAVEFVDEDLLPLLEPGDEDNEYSSNSLFVMNPWGLRRTIQDEKDTKLRRAMNLQGGKLISELEIIKQEELDIQDVEGAELIQKVIDEKNRLRNIPHNPEDVTLKIDFDKMQESYNISIKFKDSFTVGKFKEFLLEKHSDIYEKYTFWGDKVDFRRNYTKKDSPKIINQTKRTQLLIKEFNQTF